MEIVTGVFVYGPLCVCFQSSDSEVRRLSEELSERDGALQQLEHERDRLVQLDQVRVRKNALSNTTKEKIYKCKVTKYTPCPQIHKFTLVHSGYKKTYLW